MAQGSMQGPNRNLMPMILAFLAGAAVGANWPKISKQLKPYLDSLGEKTGGLTDSVAKFFAEHKEKIEDKIAAAKVTKKAKAVKTKSRAGR